MHTYTQTPMRGEEPAPDLPAAAATKAAETTSKGRHKGGHMYAHIYIYIYMSVCM